MGCKPAAAGCDDHPGKVAGAIIKAAVWMDTGNFTKRKVGSHGRELLRSLSRYQARPALMMVNAQADAQF